MKKGLLMLLAGLMTIAASVSAFADARLDSMAADARQVGDIDLIWLYPNMVVDYKNTVDFRMFPYQDEGEGENEWGGALIEVDPDFGVLGAYVNRPTNEDSSYSNVWGDRELRTPSHYDQGSVGNAPWWVFPEGYNNEVDLFWAKNIGGNTFGLHFNYGSGGTDESVYGLDAGLGLGNVGPFGDLNVHAGYAFENFNFGGGDVSNGIYTAKLGAISTNALNADNDLRSFVDFQLDGYKSTDDGDIDFGGAAKDYSDFTFDLGTGVNHKIDSGKGLVSSGLKLEYIGASNGTEVSADEWSLLWNASVEAPVNDWLTLRSGLTKAIIVRQYDKNDVYDEGTYTDNSGDNVQFSTGVGINWQNFTLNASVNAESLEDSIADVHPGQGIFFTGNIVEVETADLSYKF